MAEWGFRDRATAEAALRARERRLRSHRSGALRRRLQQARPSTPLSQLVVLWTVAFFARGMLCAAYYCVVVDAREGKCA